MKQVMNYHKDNGLLNMIRRTDPMITYYIQNETVGGNITINSNVIKAGTNVTNTKPQGPVFFDGGVINLNGNTVELHGETTVTLGTTLNINQ